MTKRKIVTFSIIGIFLTTLIITNYLNNDGIIIASNTTEEQFKNAISLMLETEYQSGEYQTSSNNTWPQDGYIFNEILSRCENGGKLIWNEDSNSITLKTSISDRCYIYYEKKLTISDVCNDGDNFGECIANYHNLTGDDYDGIYYHDGTGSYTNAPEEANDNSYRYAGANPNNYICFGSDDTICPEDNLYRIIGVFESKLKLIKATSYGNYTWGANDNIWASANSNSILNTEFLNNLDTKWQEMITINSWKIGGMNYSNGVNTPKNVFNYEVKNSNSVYDSKIGLLYASDYGYGADPEYWHLMLRNYTDANKKNWLYNEEDEWVISSAIVDSLSVFFISSSGINTNFSTTRHAIRPTFYLNTNIIYKSGTGTENEPYIIGM